MQVSPRLQISDRELELHFVTSSGPGGQNVNKRATKAVLRWDVAHSESIPAEVKERFLDRFANRVSAEGKVVVMSDRYRDQSMNRADCKRKLAEMVRTVEYPRRRRRRTRPSKSAVERRLREKHHRAATKARRQASKRIDDE